jgi:hypothetical protein
LWQVLGEQQLHREDTRRVVQASVSEGAVSWLQNLNFILVSERFPFYLCRTFAEAHLCPCCRYIEGNHFRPGTRPKGTNTQGAGTA